MGDVAKEMVRGEGGATSSVWRDTLDGLGREDSGRIDIAVATGGTAVDRAVDLLHGSEEKMGEKNACWRDCVCGCLQVWCKDSVTQHKDL